jgi:pyruvate-ferredoxin/flavodoxin oxidoreductase
LGALKKAGTFVLKVSDTVDLNTFLPASLRKRLADSSAKFYRVDASRIATETGMAGRINMVMQAVFFGLSEIMPSEKCIALMKKSIAKQFQRKGRDVIDRNCAMVDKSLSAVREVKYGRVVCAHSGVCRAMARL